MTAYSECIFVKVHILKKEDKAITRSTTLAAVCPMTICYKGKYASHSQNSDQLLLMQRTYFLARTERILEVLFPRIRAIKRTRHSWELLLQNLPCVD